MDSNLLPTCDKCNCTLVFGALQHLACNKSEAGEYTAKLKELSGLLSFPNPSNILVDYIGLSLCQFGIHDVKIQSETEIRGNPCQVFDCGMIRKVIDAELVRINALLEE